MKGLMNNKKKITIITASVLALILAVAGIAAAVRATTSTTVPVLPVSNLNYGEMMDWENSVTGTVTSDGEQNIYLSDTETVEEVLVTEGQSVRKGDVLFRYDTRSTKLKLEKEKINREKIELAIEVARENLRKLDQVSPVSEDDGDFGFAEDFFEFDETEAYEKATVYVKELKADAKPVNDDPEDTLLGTEYNPYVFLCDGDSIVITKDFIKKWQKTAKKNKMKQLYFAVEKRDKKHSLLKAWETDVMLMDPKYDIEVDLYTGKTLYANMKEPAQVAALLRKVIKEIPADEQGAWLAMVLDKLAITTEKEEKLQERGGLLAAAINELNTKDRKELAGAAAQLDGATLSTILKSLSPEQISEIDKEVIAEFFAKILENMKEEQIKAIDPEVLAGFVKMLTPEQLLNIDPDKLGAVISGFDEEQLKVLLDNVSEENKELIRKILEEEKAKEEQSGEGSSDDNPGSNEDTDPDGGNSDSDDSGSGNSGSGSEDSGGSGSGDTGDDSGGGSGGDNTGDQGGGADQPADSDSDSGSGSGDGDGSGEEGNGGNDDAEGGAGDGNSDGTASDASAGETESSAEGTTPSTAPSPANDSADKGSGGGDLLSDDVEYTSSELEKAKREQKETLKGLELDLRESDIKIAQAERAVENGVVKANMNGEIRFVGDPKSPPTDGSAFLSLAGAEGLYIRSGIKESLYGTIKVGDKVNVVSWMSGGRFEAEIKSISPYPDTEGNYGDEGETYYPFTASVNDGSEGLNNGEWVEVTYVRDSESADTNSATLTIMKAFVREEGNKKYVFKRDENGRLKKQYVETGLLSDNGYEILSGLTESDWIAFPYGKNVKEGAPTREGSVEELYN